MQLNIKDTLKNNYFANKSTTPKTPLTQPPAFSAHKIISGTFSGGNQHQRAKPFICHMITQEND
jgi:hypothetical protein